MESTDTYLDEFRKKLVVPGNILVFIDDTGTPEKPLGAHLVRDYKAHVAIVVKSENYAAYLDEHKRFLNTYPSAEEFHAVDVFQGRKEWKHCDVETRRRAFETFVDMVGQWVEMAYFIGIGIDQYNELTQKAQAIAPLYPENVQWNSHSEGSRIVLLKSIMGRIQNAYQRPIVVIEDAESQKIDVMEHMFQESCNVHNASVYRIDSKNIPGLQLADLAAYCFNRRYHIIAKQKDGLPLRELDPHVIAFWQKHSDKYVDSLSRLSSPEERRLLRNRRKRELRDMR
jgi:hypothetical protein